MYTLILDDGTQSHVSAGFVHSLIRDSVPESLTHAVGVADQRQVAGTHRDGSVWRVVYTAHSVDAHTTRQVFDERSSNVRITKRRKGAHAG